MSGVSGMHSKEMLEYVATALVDHPEEVRVNEVEGDRVVVLELRVASSDMGKVIGRNGRIARALRTVTKAAATRDGKMVHVEIVE